MSSNPPNSIKDFYPMKLGGIPTISGVSGISGLGTPTTTTRQTPIPIPSSDDKLSSIVDHLKSISININNISTNMKPRQTSIVQLLETLDNSIDDDEIIVICKNPIKRDDAANKLGSTTAYESLSDAVQNISPTPDVKNIISSI